MNDSEKKKLIEIIEKKRKEENSSKDDIMIYIYDNYKEFKSFKKILKFLSDNNIKFSRSDSESFRDMIYEEFKNNNKISYKDLSEKLKDSNLKEKRIKEYMNYYYDLWFKLSNLNSK